MTNFTLTEALLALWECDDSTEARDIVDVITLRTKQMTARNIPHPFI